MAAAGAAPEWVPAELGVTFGTKALSLPFAENFAFQQIAHFDRRSQCIGQTSAKNWFPSSERTAIGV